MSVDVIGNFLTRIRNGVAVTKHSVEVPYSKLKHQVALVLKQEGFVRDVAVVGDVAAAKMLVIHLKYVNGESAIHTIKRVSKPGCRVYKGSRELPVVIGGLGVAIVTTSRGVMTNKQAKELSLGGEVLCTIW